MPKLSIQISVLTYKRPASLNRTLQKIAFQGLKTLSPHFEVRVRVFDNANDARVEKVLAAYPAFSLVQHATNLGLSGNFNYAVDDCDSDWLWVVADDDELEFDWAEKFPILSDFDHLILKRRDRAGNQVEEDLLQRNIGLSNNIYNSHGAKAALAVLRQRAFENTTYPQVLLAQVLNSQALDAVAYSDSQPTKNYSLEGFLRVVIRDIVKLASSAKCLGVPRSERRLITKLALSHLAQYGSPFLSRDVAVSAKKHIERELQTRNSCEPPVLSLAKTILSRIIQASRRWPLTTERAAAVGLRLVGLSRFIENIENGADLVPGTDGDYFDYEPAINQG